MEDLRELVLFDALPEFFCELASLAAIYIAADNDEFFAAPAACHDLLLSRKLSHQVCKMLEGSIADGVAVIIVY